MKGFIVTCAAYLLCGLMALGAVSSLLMSLFMVGYALVIVFFTLKGFIFDLHSITACGDLCPR